MRPDIENIGMFDRFEPESRQVMARAREEALKLRHDYLGTEHVLLSLLRERETLAATALARHADPDAAYAQLQPRLPIGDLDDQLSQLPFTPNMKRALEEAIEEVAHLGIEQIESIHLLMGLTRVKNSEACHGLAAIDVDPIELRNTAYELLGIDEAKRRPERLRRAPALRFVLMLAVVVALVFAITRLF